jgi:hypothetical protein
VILAATWDAEVFDFQCPAGLGQLIELDVLAAPGG